ncbi:MAG: DUF1588 domain-containing protein [Planctomycetota bacterium]
MNPKLLQDWILRACTGIRLGVLGVILGSAAVLAQENESPGFDESIRPFLSTHCVECHAGDNPAGDLNLEALKPDFSKDELTASWVRVMESLKFAEMPPPDEDQPDAFEKATVVDWILDKMVATGRFDAYQKKLIAPEYGNWINHEKLFSGEIKTRAFSPTRLWRFSPEAFQRKGFGRARSPFNYVTSEKGIRDYAAMSSVDRSTVQMSLLAAETFLEGRQSRGEFRYLEEGSEELTEQRLNDTVRREFNRIIGRYPRDDERDKYLTFWEENAQIGGRLAAFKLTVKAMFLSPEAIYRMEFGLGKQDEYGRRMLSSDELAYALSYTLTDRTPEHTEPIRNAWNQGKLETQEDVARVVRQVLDEQLCTGRWSNRRLPRIMRFFDEFFGFHRVDVVFKDQQRRNREGIAQWNTDYMVHDARMLIEYLLKQDKDFVAELLTTNKYFVAHPGDNEYAREFYDQQIEKMTKSNFVEEQVAKKRKNLLNEQAEFKFSDEEFENRMAGERRTAERRVARYTMALAAGIHPHPNFPFTERSRGLADLLYVGSYNLPTCGIADEQKWDWPVEQPFEMPADQRAGILTMPAWLGAYSLNDGNDPIRRGIWVRTKLLAGVIQDVPPDVDATISTDPHLTLRERMQPLRAQECWRCHEKMNPLGETFEIFDDWGRYRTHLYFDKNEEIVLRRDHQFDRMLAADELTTRAVDSAGFISGSGDSSVDGEVKDAIEMIHRIGRSERARQSFIRHLFRYFMGRNEMYSDSQTLIAAEEAYLAEGGSFKALVVSLLSSDSFLYRR